jgi:cation transport ATPase
LYLEGVHCAACVWLVEKLPEVVPGVIESRLDMRRSLVRVRWDESQAKLSQVARMLDSLGYPPHPAKDAQARELQKQEDRKFLIRIGVAAACAGNVMTLSFALYGGAFTGIEAEYSNLFRLTSMAFGLVSLIWPGSLFFRGAWAALRTRTAHLDLPIALGLAAGGFTGTVNAVLGRGEIYFDSLTMLVFLLLVGRWIQRRQQRWANDAVELLFSITPSSARRVEEDAVREVPVEALQPGDVVEIRAGDSVPTDGVVLEGNSSVDQSLLTGESDHPDVVSKVAKRLSVPEAQARGAASPEQKVAYLEDLMKNADTVMVGDGVNDAAALAAATVGIAVHGGAEASLASADVYLSRPGLTPIVDLIRAARRTVRTIRLSLLASLCYNVVAAALAMAGIIGPLTAAVLMPISSFTVVTLALASRTFGDDS